MNNQLQQFGKMTIDVYESPDQNFTQVSVDVSDEKKLLKMLAMTAAFLTHIVAQKSNLGYEKTLETLTDDSMSYKITGVQNRRN